MKLNNKVHLTCNLIVIFLQSADSRLVGLGLTEVGYLWLIEFDMISDSLQGQLYKPSVAKHLS